MTLLGDARKARRMKGKMEEAAPAKRVTVAPLQGEMTTEEVRENNGEFNMAPRGSFNHLIESPACFGFPPSSFAPHLRPVLISTNTFGRTDDYLRTISCVSSSLHPPPPLFFSSGLYLVASPLSQPCNIRSHSSQNSSSLDRYPPESDERADVPR